ncbi:MAG TPA: hypothetical protein VLG40_04390 [Candidatus Saccharimonas sp.]|nr:hypothetical protein [Candidatus Saccharimonas sp.]
MTNGEEINPVTGKPWAPADLDKLLNVIKSDETKPEPKTEDKKDD